jgi:hypothetical protein
MIGGASRACALPTDGLPPSGGTTRPWLDPEPTGGEVLWLPGLNSRRCRGVLTPIDRDHAVRIAGAVDAAKPFPPGIYHCPMDDASSATVFLFYAGTKLAELVRIKLGGCGGVSAPGRSTVEDRFLNELGPGPAGLH